MPGNVAFIIMPGNGQLISVHPEELKFQFELEKQSYCDLKVANNTEKYVAFKVKTTSPKKYFVRPNTGVIQPWDSCVIRVTLQAQREYPPDMQCKDKFLLQSTIVAPQTEVDELPPDTFNKDSGNTIQECKLRVVYLSPQAALGNADDEALKGFKRSFDNSTMHSYSGSDDNHGLQRLKDERDTVVRQTQQLQQELEMLKRRRPRKSDPGFSFKFALFVGLVGIMVGLLLNLSLSSPSTTE
ncbi:Vesicle-associated protein 2-1 [Sarracenia purpurea var. burkii]